jgi:hypothetical protein
MNEFKDVLDKVRRDHEDLFEQAARRDPDEEELVVEVQDFDVPDRKEINQREQIDRPPDLEIDETQSDDWWDLDDEEDKFEQDSQRSRREREAYRGRPRREVVERLAVYLPFHLYPAGSWGVLFFERPMARFTDRLYMESRRGRLRYSWVEVLKIATYAVARHEFVHYMLELEALDLELKLGRRFYVPYSNTVYKHAFPGTQCLEETVANVWSWDNSVFDDHRRLRRIYKSALSSTPLKCYARGADFDRTTVRSVEDELAAQVYQCADTPKSPPPVWGSIPRPYVQPWTRYENVSFMMTRTLGGVLGRYLRARPIRKTMRVYHR